MDKLVSVIIPVYNVQDYLNDCLDSVINQSYKNLEIILIDDGSKDSSGIICNEYAKKDERIKVIHQKNKGLSSARNTGLKAMKGEYISFIDSDDIIYKDFIKILYDAIEESNADVSVCSYQRFFNKENLPDEIISDDFSILSNVEVIKRMCTNGEISPAVWNKLYKRELFSDVEFPEGKIHEDEFVTPVIISKSKIYAVCKSELYFYRTRKNSIMGDEGTFDKKHLAAIKAFENRCRIFDTKEYAPAYSEIVRSLFYMISYYYYHIKNDSMKLRNKLYCRYRCAVDIFLFGVKIPKYIVKPYVIFVLSPSKFKSDYALDLGVISKESEDIK